MNNSVSLFGGAPSLVGATDMYKDEHLGKTCEPKAFSFQCMTKFTTKKKKIKFKKNKNKTDEHHQEDWDCDRGKVGVCH